MHVWKPWTTSRSSTTIFLSNVMLKLKTFLTNGYKRSLRNGMLAKVAISIQKFLLQLNRKAKFSLMNVYWFHLTNRLIHKLGNVFQYEKNVRRFQKNGVFKKSIFSLNREWLLQRWQKPYGIVDVYSTKSWTLLAELSQANLLQINQWTQLKKLS